MTNTSATSTTASPASDAGRWYSSSSGFASIGAVLVVTAGLLVGLFGFGHADHTITFLRGNAWLSNDETGAVVRVNAATGQPDFEMKFTGAAGDDLEVIQGPDGVFVLNRTTGEVTKLDDSHLTLGGAVKIDPADQPLFVLGGGKAYLAARRTGRIQPVDPQSANLDAIGPPIELGHPLANALVDDRGRLSAALPDTGDLAFVIDGRRDAPVHVTDPDHRLTVSLVDDQLVAIDHTTRTVTPVDPATGVLAVFSLDLPPDTDLAVADKMTGSQLWITARDRGELLSLDLRTGRQVHIPLPDTATPDLGAPLPNGGFVYVPDFSKGDLVKVDIDQAKVVDRVPVGATKGKFDSFVKDERVWGNDSVGQLAVVIDHDGHSQKIEKYRPGLPTNQDDGFGTPPATTPPATSPARTTPPSTSATTTPPASIVGGAEGDPNSGPATSSTTTPKGPGDPTGRPSPGGIDLSTTTTEPRSGADPGSKESSTSTSTSTTTTSTPTTPPRPSAGVPGATAPVTGLPGDASVMVRWTAAVDNGSPLTKYVVTSKSAAFTAGTPIDVPSTDTFVMVTGLTNGTTYTFGVYAVNAIGDGPTSSSAPVSPLANAPGAPGNVQAVLIADPAAPTQQTAIRVTWDQTTAHPELARDYRVDCVADAPAPVPTTTVPVSTTIPAPTAVTVPANSATYSVVLSGQHRAGYNCSVEVLDTAGVAGPGSSAPATLQPFGKPSVATALGGTTFIPSGAKAGSLSDGTLNWTAPTDDGGRGIDSYEAEIEVFDGSSSWSHYTSWIAPAPGTAASGGVASASTYRFHVRARGSVDGPTGLQFTSDWSDYYQLTVF